MTADLRCPAGGDKGCDGDEAAITGGKLRAAPDVAEEDVVGKLAEPRRDIVDGCGRDAGSPGFPGLGAGGFGGSACGGECRKGDGGGYGLHEDLRSLVRTR